MNAASIVALVLVLAVAVGIRRSWRTPRHRAARIGLQIAAALLLYLCLFPPTTREDFAAGELVVATPGATSVQLAALSPAASVVVLPGVDAARAIERAPDLATALRRHADARRLRIVGGGLPARDRDAARGLVAAFEAAPLPRALIALNVPASVRVGSVWRIDGCAEGIAGGRVELRDPAGAVVAAQALDAQGRFALSAAVKGEGTALFALHLLDRDGARVDTVSVPLAARAGAALKILLLAGAPDPELKYLRRWAADAGLALDSRIALSDGIALNEGKLAFDAQALRAADIAIVDERAWAALDAPRKQALIAAVHDGLGLLLRVSGPLPAPVAADWAELGFRTQAIEASPPLVLDETLDLADSGLAFARHALAVETKDAAPLLRADDGSTLARVGNLGRGRVALWLLADSYRLSLGGATSAYGTLWSDALTAVARARGEAAPSLPTAARVDERAVFCGVANDAAIENEAGARTPLIVDGATHCAAHWPDAQGWQALLSGGQRWPFHVRARDEAPTLAAGETARATHALVGASAASAASATRARPLPSWPFFFAWLALSALLWWLERAGGITNDDPHIAGSRVTH